jgi:RHS repeat-associated protein
MRTFTYDGENRLVGSTQPNTGAIWYSYDGAGRRVQKTVGSTVTTYAYDGSGQLAAEYTNVASAGANTEYLIGDILGSTRAILDGTGAAKEWIDYLPFGEEIPSGVGQRGSGYSGGVYPGSADIASQKFTGKERDAETGLDYFGARYFSAAQGRWTSPDWSAVPQPVPYATLSNPQSLNLYQYVLNNPLSQKDDDGHEIIYADGLKNGQLVKDSVTAILANPNTRGYLSGYVGPNAPNLTIQSGDLGPPKVEVLPNGQTLTTTVQGNTAPDIQTATVISNGVTTSETTLTAATITLDNKTSKGDTPGVMIHEAVHAGEAQQNPAKFVADAKAEKPTPHDQRPQEQRANSVRHANEKDINKAVKQIEKDRKKEQ